MTNAPIPTAPPMRDSDPPAQQGNRQTNRHEGDQIDDGAVTFLHGTPCRRQSRTAEIAAASISATRAQAAICTGVPPTATTPSASGRLAPATSLNRADSSCRPWPWQPLPGQTAETARRRRRRAGRQKLLSPGISTIKQLDQLFTDHDWRNGEHHPGSSGGLHTHAILAAKALGSSCARDRIGSINADPTWPKMNHGMLTSEKASA